MADLGRLEALAADVLVITALAAVQLIVLRLVGAVQVGSAVREQRLAVQVVLVVRCQAAVHASILHTKGANDQALP